MAAFQVITEAQPSFNCSIYQLAPRCVERAFWWGYELNKSRQIANSSSIVQTK